MSQYQNRINYCNSLQNYVLVSWYSGVDAMPSLLLFLKYRLPYGMAAEDVKTATRFTLSQVGYIYF